MNTFEALEGSGVMWLDNGETVTKLFAPSTLALSALALEQADVELPTNLDLDKVMMASDALHDQRGNEHGFIEARHINELTNSDGGYSVQVKEYGLTIDPAINALAVKNDFAISHLAGITDAEAFAVRGRAFNTEDRLGIMLHNSFVRGDMTDEETLATARLGFKGFLDEENLRKLFAMPSESDSHPEKRHLSMAECIEAARLTPIYEASQEYLARVLPKIAQLGAFTRFEGIAPTDNAIVNKIGRKQIWLPTAAQVVQIKPETIS